MACALVGIEAYPLAAWMAGMIARGPDPFRVAAPRAPGSSGRMGAARAEGPPRAGAPLGPDHRVAAQVGPDPGHDPMETVRPPPLGG